MRTILLLAVLSVLVAGCASNGGNNPSTPAVGGNTTGTGAGMAPKQAASDSHDFATDAAAGTPAGQGATTKAFTMDAGYTKLTLNVTFDVDSPAPGSVVAQDVVVKVGSLTCTVSAGPVTPPIPPCTKSGNATPGPMKIEYSGAGAVTATVKVIES